MYAVFAGLICTTSSVKPDNNMYFCSKRFKIIYFIKYMYYKLVKIVCTALVPAKCLSMRWITCQHIHWAVVQRLKACIQQMSELPFKTWF